MEDKLIRAAACEGDISVIVACTRGIVSEATARHDLSPTPSAALGRTLTACLMMAEELKNDGDSVTLTINGGGPAGSVVATAGTDCTVRGYIDNPHAEAPLSDRGKLNVGGIVGRDGTVTVSRSDGRNLPYNGMTRLVSGEIAEDVSSYYAESEQKATAVALGVLVSPDGQCLSAGGALIHVLPAAREESVAFAEKQVAELSDISGKLRDMTCGQLLAKLFPDAVILAEKTPRFECKCGKHSIDKVIASLGREEAETVLRERGAIEVVCRFCGKRYEYNEEDVRAVF